MNNNAQAPRSTEPPPNISAEMLDDIHQQEANLKLVRRWLANVLMRIETLIQIEEDERENNAK